MKDKILSKLKEILVYNEYRDTYIIREDNLSYFSR